jgi:hypothetical protein
MTLFSDLYNVGVPTTSADLAIRVSDETGTGNLVFNTNPTFEGSIRHNGVEHFTQSSLPSTRPDGSPLIKGDRWFNPNTGSLLWHTGNSWNPSPSFAYSPRPIALSTGTSSVTGSVSFSQLNALIARFSYADAATGNGRLFLQAWGATKNYTPFGEDTAFPFGSILRMQVTFAWRNTGIVRAYWSASPITAGSDLTTRGFGMKINASTGDIYAQHHSGSALTTSSSLATVLTPGADELDTYEIIYDGTNANANVYIYRNGTYLGSVSAPRTPEAFLPIITLSVEADGTAIGQLQYFDFHYLELQRLF